jgi:sugar phosphate isomerase/epimerase
MKKSFFLSTLFALSLAFTTSGADDHKHTGTGASFKGPIGLQLYSLRDDFKKDVPGTLDKVKEFGITYVELASTYGMTAEKFLPMLKERGLRAVSAHFPYERYRDDLDAVVKEAKALGLRYSGCAWIPHKDDFDEKECRDAAAVFNKAGEALSKVGIKFFYHTHGYEFQPHGNGTLFDLLLSETKPNLVTYQMDVFWVVHPGQDPVKLMAKYPNRFELMHVKDMKKGLKTGNLSGGADVSNDVALGTGQMNWPAILAQAKKIGIKYYFIEDESPTAAQQIPQSLHFLEQVKF